MSKGQKQYDALVVGLGAMGAATLYQLGLRGKKVLGIDQFSPPHPSGSSHGDTRITRQAIGEGEQYVPLALRSHELWREMEKKSGEKLLFPIGGLIIGDPSSNAVNHNKLGFVRRTIAAAEKFGISHEVLEYAALRKRFPQFAVSSNEIGYFEHGAGFVRPEACVEVQLALAKDLGCEVITNQKVTEILLAAGSSGALVKTANASFHADQVVVCAGSWIHSFLKKDHDYFKIYRQLLLWFSPQESIAPFLPDKFPIFIWSFSHPEGDGSYGFPAIDGPKGGVKIATENYIAVTDPDAPRREVSQEEIKAVYDHCIRDKFPLLSPACVRAVSCLYTATRDFDFVIERCPESPQIIIVSPCSGHGFKHSAAIGESVSELVCSGSSRIDLTNFIIKRSS